MDSPLVIIPARGGSKGIPGKNIKPLAGRPLLAYALDCARAVAPDSHIILSTDAEEIADCARAQGLPVGYMRPPELATDTAPTRDALLHALDWAEGRELRHDCIVLLQPTSPLRSPADVQGALELYRRHAPDVDMVVSVTEAACNPYYDCFEAGEGGLLHVSKGPGTFTRRQDAPPCWQYNGAVYVISPAALRLHPLGEMPRRLPYPMPRERSLDLDTPLDWEIATLMMRNR